MLWGISQQMLHSGNSGLKGLWTPRLLCLGELDRCGSSCFKHFKHWAGKMMILCRILNLRLEHTCNLPISEGCQDMSRQAMYSKHGTCFRNLTSPSPEGTHNSNLPTSNPVRLSSFAMPIYGCPLPIPRHPSKRKLRSRLRRSEAMRLPRSDRSQQTGCAPPSWAQRHGNATRNVKPCEACAVKDCMLALPSSKKDQRHLERSDPSHGNVIVGTWSSSLQAIWKSRLVLAVWAVWVKHQKKSWNAASWKKMVTFDMTVVSSCISP